MKKIIKLLSLITVSISVYFIYINNCNKNIRILNIGDGLSMGINSYGIDDYSYTDYYKEYLNKKNKKVEINNRYTAKDQSIKIFYAILRNNNEVKKDLISSHILIVCLGFNDLLYKISIEQNMNNNKLNKIVDEIDNNYNEMIKEIRKYYKEEIIVIGYYSPNIDNYYIDNGLRKLNRYLKNNKDIVYIDTYNEIKSEKYLPNPGSYYPNNRAYQLIASKIIAKTLEK